MFNSSSQIKTINNSLSGKKPNKKGAGPVKFYLVLLLFVMIGFMGVVVYKFSGQQQESAAASNSNLGARIMKAAEDTKKQQQQEKTDDFLQRAQQENLKEFQANLKDEDPDKAVESEWEMLERRAAEERQKAVKSEEAQWKAQGSVNRWGASETIPQWLKEYFVWHNEQRAQINENNWRDFRYIILTCLHDEECGNVLHRIRPIPGHLRAAYDSKRIFLIHWDQPDRLEDYLEPPHHGSIDWIVPSYMMRAVRKVGTQVAMDVIEEQASHVDRVIVSSKFFDDSFAEDIWNSRRKEGEVTADRAFHDVFNVLFKPTFMMQERISEALHLLGLKEGQYAAAHIDYDMQPWDDNEAAELKARVENAMNCLSQIAPGGPWFVAAQTYDIARLARAYAKQNGISEIHVKQITHESNKNPTDIYNSFVEIYFMGNAKCVAYNRGGYGQMGYILGYDYDCRVKYSNPRDHKCDWKSASEAQK